MEDFPVRVRWMPGLPVNTTGPPHPVPRGQGLQAGCRQPAGTRDGDAGTRSGAEAAVRPQVPGLPPLDPEEPIPDDPGPLLPDDPDDLPPAPHEPSPFTEPAPPSPEPEPV